VMRLLDFVAIEERAGHEDTAVRAQLENLSKDVPELLDPQQFRQYRGRADKPVLKPEKPLTREEVAAMSEDEVNSRWDQVKAFLSGERG
jgi:hypothetical protein